MSDHTTCHSLLDAVERYFDLMYRLNLAIVQSLEAGGIQVSAPRKL